VTAVVSAADSDDITAFGGLGSRSPFLAGGLTLGFASLAGVPPFAGFFGKFWLFKAVATRAGGDPWFLAALILACVGVVISMYYYFGVIRSMFWPRQDSAVSRVDAGVPTALAALTCVAAILVIGIFPAGLVDLSRQSVAGLSGDAVISAHAAAPASGH
jgi:NADH-quinone oxidoreductase subunit N